MPESPPKQATPWIGVDLDGTLAHHSSYMSLSSVGKPVKTMLTRVHDWLAKGYTVKIVTARATEEDSLPLIRKWLKKRKLGELEITCKIDRDCLEIWDDRAIQVKWNTGHPVRSASIHARPKAPLLEEAFPHEARPKLDIPEH